MAVQPLFGQLSDIFGRRWPMITAVSLLILGSAISGAATSGSMLITGRSVQGIGGGGIGLLIELVVCDLVPLRERSKFMAIVMMTFSLGTSIGPFIGGIIVQKSNWRWVFYLNLPIGGVALGLLVVFLQVRYERKMSLKDKMRRIDFVGNAILILSSLAILIALTDAGAKATWSSWRIILPLALGFTGLIIFGFYESSKFPTEPTVPPRLFTNRTTVIAYILSFVMAITGLWEIYFLPVYFQAVKGSTPSGSGVQVLPTFMFLLPAAITGGFLTTKFGRYRPLHLIGYALLTISFGLLSTLTSSSGAAAWVLYQAIAAIGSGLVLSSVLAALQADLDDAGNASSTAVFAFIRNFGAVWGIDNPGGSLQQSV
jgi:MFS family permease